jgi:hypothetical protein
MIFISTRPDGGRPPEQAFSNSHANLNPALLARVSPRCLPSRPPAHDLPLHAEVTAR